MRKYYTLLVFLVSVLGTYAQNIPTKNPIDQFLLAIDKVSYIDSEFFIEGLSLYGMSIILSVTESELYINKISLPFDLPLLISSKNFEINASSKTVCL